MDCVSVATFGALSVTVFSHRIPYGPCPLSRGFPWFPSVLGSHTYDCLDPAEATNIQVTIIKLNYDLQRVSGGHTIKPK